MKTPSVHASHILTPSRHDMRVAIIGSGATGLAATWVCSLLCSTHGAVLTTFLLPASKRVLGTRSTPLRGRPPPWRPCLYGTRRSARKRTHRRRHVRRYLHNILFAYSCDFLFYHQRVRKCHVSSQATRTLSTYASTMT